MYPNLLMPGRVSKTEVSKSIDDNKFVIRGYASVPILDLENEIIATEAYDDAIETVKSRAGQNRPLPIFIEHRRKELSLPVGKITDAGKDDKGMWFTGEIAGGIIGQPIRELIKGGYLYGCSIGGDAVKTVQYFDTQHNRDAKKITKMAFRELSLTGLPVNEEAVFSISKSLNKNEKEVRRLMDKLDSAIDMQKSISLLEKAVEPNNLDEQSLNRIKEALNNLAKLLQIDITDEGGEQQVETPPKTEELQKPGIMSTNTESTTGEENPQEIGQGMESTNISGNASGNTSGGMNSGVEGKLAMIAEKLDKLIQIESGEATTDENGSPKGNQELVEGDKKPDGETELVENDKKNQEPKMVEGNKKAQDKKSDKKKDFNKSLKIQGDDEMSDSRMECPNCESVYKSTDEYEVRHCPECGSSFAKSSETKEETNKMETEEVIFEDDLMCEDCGSVFGKSLSYEANYCPKCGKSLATVAIAQSPKGASTQRPTQSKMNVGKTNIDDVAVAQSPKGASTQYKNKSEAAEDIEKNLELENPPLEDTGESVSEWKDGNYIPADKKERVDMEDEDINVARPSGKPMLSSADQSKFRTYGTDRTKSVNVEDRLESIEKTLEKVLDKSDGRKSNIPSESIEKSSQSSAAPTQDSIDRSFARMILGSEK